jgi:hypothetical protein
VLVDQAPGDAQHVHLADLEAEAGRCVAEEVALVGAAHRGLEPHLIAQRDRAKHAPGDVGEGRSEPRVHVGPVLRAGRGGQVRALVVHVVGRNELVEDRSVAPVQAILEDASSDLDGVVQHRAAPSLELRSTRLEL